MTNSSLSNLTILVPLADIWVDRDRRQRRELEVDSLAASIHRNGLIHPVTLASAPGPSGESFELKTGERRLTACRQLGHTTILARLFESLDPIQAQIVELEENIKRQDLDWKEILSGVVSIHKLYSAQAGQDGWTHLDTAEACGIPRGTVSLFLRVHPELSDPRIAGCNGYREAYNILARRDQRAAGDALADLMEVKVDLLPPDVQDALTYQEDEADGEVEPEVLGEIVVQSSPNSMAGPTTSKIAPKAAPTAVPAAFDTILNLSFLDWVKTYSGPKFNLVHCDFPYGVNLFDGSQGRGAEPQAGYEDTQELFFTLLEDFCLNLDTFMSGSAHLLFWYSAKHNHAGNDFKMSRMFAKLAPSLEFAPHPLIWHKTDNAGIASDPRRNYRHVYETCLFGSRSKRQILSVKGDAYGSPTDKTLHPSTKPEPMLKHFMSGLVDNETAIFDPTAGSGAALRAAESLGAKRSFGLEIDPLHCKVANQALRNARSLRATTR